MIPLPWIALAVRAGLQAIEWGGGVHVHHRDVAHAQTVKQKCATAAYIRKAMDNALRIADLAATQSCTVVFEYHRGALTAGVASVAEPAAERPHPAVGFYWQPPLGYSYDQCRTSLEAVLGCLCNLHVFHSDYTTDDAGKARIERRLLGDGEARWRSRF